MRLLLARRNDYTLSEQLDNAAWSKFNATVSANAVAAPNGTTTADKLVEDTNTSAHTFFRDFSGAANSTPQTLSVFAKSAGRTAFRLVGRTKAAAEATADFDLTAGTVSNLSGAISAAIHDAGSGWYRCILTYNSGTGATALRMIVRMLVGGGISYTGDGSSGIYFWGMQAEVDQSDVSGYASTEATVFLSPIGTQPLIDSIELAFDSEEKVTRADLSWQATDAAMPVGHGNEVIIDDRGTTVFVGRVTNIEWFRQSNKAMIRAVCLDYAHLMARTEIDSLGKNYVSQSDRAIIQDLITVAGLNTLITTDSANVDIVLSSTNFAFPSDMTVLQALDMIADRAGAQWTIDPNIAPANKVALHYNTEANAGDAPFDVSDAPNLTTTFPHIGLTVGSFFDRPGNLIRVVGGRDLFGRQITATTSDATSITAYGEKFLRFSSPSITTQTYANNIAAALLAKYKDPQLSASFVTTRDGLRVNQIIGVTDASFGLSNEQMLIRTIRTSQKRGGASHLSTHRVTAGSDRSNENRILRQLDSLASGPNTTPVVLRGMDLTGNKSFWNVQDTVPNASLFKDATGGMTVSFWARRYGTLSGFLGIFTATSSSEASTDGYTFKIQSAGGLILRSGGEDWSASGPGNDGLWHHYCAAWDGTYGATALKVYIDGVSKTVTNSGSGSWNLVSTSDLSVGGIQNIVLSQIAAWNIQLQDGDIQKLAARPDPGIPGEILPSHQVAFWKMDGFADGVTIPTSSSIQDAWNDFHGFASVTVSGDFGVGRDQHWTPLV